MDLHGELFWRVLENEGTFRSAYSSCYAAAVFHKHGPRLSIVIGDIASEGPIHSIKFDSFDAIEAMSQLLH